MSNQIVISSGAKVRSLEGVLTGTAGIVNSVPLGGANGVATLDSLGKVPLSQLPASVVTYLGTWNAATNTPTLTNGVGDVGDLYICNVAGTVNFGAGPITFAVGDWVIYSGTEWQKSSGASGTVTSVAVTESGDALTITGSPITTSGTINIGFAGTGSQYIKGDGTLATFPTTIDQAKRLITEVYNSTGATLSKGTVVYINGGQGNLPTVTKAQANADNTSAQTYGVVQSDITNNNNGFVVVIGSLTDIDTQAYAVGTQLYLSGTTAGDWTSTKPSAPIHLVYVGIVVRSHPTQGVVEIRIQNGYELEELHDVAISAPVNNQGIFYNSSNDLWENKSIATALGYTPANDALVVHLAGTETITGVKNFDIGLTLRDGYYPTPANGYIGLASNGSGLTILTKPSATVYNHNLQFQASSNDYNFPAITGVMAMLEGTQTFSGAKTFTDNTIFSASPLFDQSANYKVGASLVGTGNYIAMAFDKSGTGSGSTLSMKLADGTTAKAINLDFVGSPATYTYTFPALTGTLALLEGTQTFTGFKTFSATTSLNTIYVDGLSYIKNQTSTTSYITGYTTFSAKANGIIEYYFPTAYKSILDFNDGADYTYTFPAASGTIALTSNLSSYVPYTGATADVNLGTTYSLSANNITAAGVVKSDFGLQLKSGLTTTISGYLSISAQKVSTNSQLNVYTDTGFYFSLIAPNTANYSYTFPATSGTIALTSNLSSYLPLTGGTLTGALNGTSATFSSVVSAIADSNAASFIAQARTADDLAQIQFKNNAASNTNALISVLKVGTNGGQIQFLTKPDGSPLAASLTLASTGAATFSSSVTANSTISAYYGSITSGNTPATSGTTPVNPMLNLTNNRGIGMYFGGKYSGDYAQWIQVSDVGNLSVNYPLLLNPNGGNVGIGTSDPQSILNGFSSSARGMAISNAYPFLGFNDTDGGNFFVGTQANLAYLWNGGTDAMIFATANTERMRITSGGGVGIGTTSVTGTYKCRIINNNAVNGDPLFAVDNNIYNGILVYSAGADGYNGAATVMVMGRNTSTSRSINAGGSINASGSDYAEYMTKAIEETIAKGDIVGVDKNGLLTNIFADAKSFVVKSTDPSYVGGDTWGIVDNIGKLAHDATDEEKAEHEAKLEEARAKVDRIAFCGQVPCNVLGANVGDYIIPINDNGKITGQAVTNPTFEQYQISVGKVWKIMEDGRAWIAVKIG